MAKLRIVLTLALALLFVSPACDVGAGCVNAGSESCQGATPEGGASSGGLSGPALLPGTTEPAATVGKAERLQATACASSTARLGHGLSPASNAPAPAALIAAATPLYLSHCAFLC